MTVGKTDLQLTSAPDPLDQDPADTRDWLSSLSSVVAAAGAERGRFLLNALEQHAQELGVVFRAPPYSAYRNTIPLAEQAAHPEELDDAVLERFAERMRREKLPAIATRAFLRSARYVAEGGATVAQALDSNRMAMGRVERMTSPRNTGKGAPAC